MLIAQRCGKCGHPDYRVNLIKDANRCECGCKCPPLELGKPEALPTFDIAGRKVERVLKPGSKLGAGLDNGLGNTDGTGVITSASAECVALFEQLTRLGSPTVEKPPAARPSPAALREWAAEAGIDCPPVGRVPARVAEAYAAAHNQ